MQTFLLAVAGVVVGLVLVVALAWFWLKRKLKGFGKALEAFAAGLSSVPPFRITLQPSEAPQWQDAAAVEHATRGLQSAGYQRVGDFDVAEMEGVIMRGFWHPESRSYATAYEHPEAGVVVDVVGLFSDRSLLTVSTVPETGLDRPDRYPMLRMELDSIADTHLLHERLVAETGSRTPLPTTAGEFVRAVEGSYRMEQNWRIARGGVTADEVRRAAAAGGLEEPDDCAVELVQATWRSAIAEFVHEEILKAFLAGNPMPAAEWEERRERVRVVHDHGEADDLADEMAWTMIAGTYDEDDDEAEERAFEAAKARTTDLLSGSLCAGFAEIQQLVPEKRRSEKIGSVTKPFAGDVYLDPEDDAY